MSKKIVISGYYGFDNFGDDAILSVLCDKLKSLNHHITVLSANPKRTKELYWVHSARNFDIKKVIQAIKESDILFSGGGSLLQDVTSFKSLFYYSVIIFLALLMRKKVVIFAQGIGPLNRPISQFLVRNLVKHASYVSVRDKKSLALLKTWGIKADLVNDPVFSLNIKKSDKVGTVGVQLRDFSTMNDTLLNKLATAVVKDFSDKKIELYVFQKTLDYEVCKKFETILKELNPEIQTEIIQDKNQKEFMTRISNLEYMIAMRFHAIIAALMAGVRTTAIDYDVKVQKLAKASGIPVISMDGSEDFEKVFQDMKTLNQSELLGFSNSKSFDWARIEELIAE